LGQGIAYIINIKNISGESLSSDQWIPMFISVLQSFFHLGEANHEIAIQDIVRIPDSGFDALYRRHLVHI